MKIIDFISAHTKRGACTCGKCFDAPENPGEKQPKGHIADLVFFKVAIKNRPVKEKLLDLVKSELPSLLDGKEHNYLKIGGLVGDQGCALCLMGLGYLLGIWELLTPNNLMPDLDESMKKQMAGMGMITIRKL